jgi:hypothetical protein
MSDDPADFARKAVEGRQAAQQQLEREQAPALKFLADREAEALQREVEAAERRIVQP